MTEKTNIRIKDIALLAGVSKGTVDRVLHNRGKVSREKEQRIRAIMEKLNFKPNVIARSLSIASKKQYIIKAIIPFYTQGQYWEFIHDGVKKAADEFLNYNIIIETIFYNQYSEVSFDDTIKELTKNNFDAVLLSTLFTESVKKFSFYLDNKKIPYVYVDSDISSTNRLAYFGIDPIASGKLIANYLLHRMNTPNASIIIGCINSYSNQGINRLKGFLEALKESNYSGKIHEISLNLDEEIENIKKLDDLFKKDPNIQGGLVVNSSAYILGNYVNIRNLKNNVIVAGYDIIKKT